MKFQTLQLLLLFITSIHVSYGQEMEIETNSNTAKSHITLKETDSNDYSRLQMQSGSGSDYWHIAGATGTLDRMNFYFNDGTSGFNLMSLNAANKRVGINTSSPSEALDIVGALRLRGDASSNKPSAGTLRWNASNSDFEGYTGSSWESFTASSGGISNEIQANSNGSNPTLTLIETEDDDYARLFYRNSAAPNDRWALSGRLGTSAELHDFGLFYNGVERWLYNEENKSFKLRNVKQEITFNSTGSSPHITLIENTANDFARIRFQGATGDDFWHIAGSTGTGDKLNFYFDNGTSGANILSLDGATLRAGIGTGSAPLAKLEINSASDEDALRVRVNGSTKLLVNKNGGVAIGVLSSNPPVNGLYVKENLGVGTSTPSERVEVNGAIRLSGTATSNNPGEGTIRWNDSTNDFEGYDGTNWKSLTGQPNPNQTTYAVGDFAQGGVVFWVTPDGFHGKVLYIHDLISPMSGAAAVWSNISNASSNAESDTDGLVNSSMIANQQGHTHSAAQLCLDLVANGYHDWYLPAVEEIDLMDGNVFIVNATISSYGGVQLAGATSNWSSTESDSDESFIFKPGLNNLGQNSNNLYKYERQKSTEAGRVRAIRSF